MKTKVKILKDQEEIILSGGLVSFCLEKDGWNLVMKGSRVVEEHPDLFEVVLDLNKDLKLKDESQGREPKSKAEIVKEDIVWLGFRIDSGIRVQIYNGEEW